LTTSCGELQHVIDVIDVNKMSIVTIVRALGPQEGVWASVLYLL